MNLVGKERYHVAKAKKREENITMNTRTMILILGRQERVDCSEDGFGIMLQMLMLRVEKSEPREDL